MSNGILDDLCSKLSKNDIEHEVDNSSKKISFQIKAGRENYKLIYPVEDPLLELMIKADFEHFKFAQGFEAIWSSHLKKIECEIDGFNTRFAPRYHQRASLLSKLRVLTNNGDSDTTKKSYEETSDIDLLHFQSIDISIGYCSDEFAILNHGKPRHFPFSRSKRELTEDFFPLNRRPLTLKISNIDISKHDHAIEYLLKFANSLLFQIDLLADIPLNIVTQREYAIEKRKLRMKKHPRGKINHETNELKNKYDNEPISSYWNAKANSNMPLFQFLAFYQTLEFYFPIYSKIEVQRKIKNLIKDPLFDSNSDSEISKILNIVKSSNKYNTFGDEKEQLKATLKLCINESELKELLEIDDTRKSFFSDKKGDKLSKCHLPFKKDSGFIENDLINQVAERVYDIRCKIVHSKSNENEYINPFSKEVNQLIYDIELVEFLARKVLIASSTPFSI